MARLPDSERQTNDQYPTPAPYPDLICDRVAGLYRSFSRIIEPSVGSGAFLPPIRRCWPGAPICAIDIDPYGPVAEVPGISLFKTTWEEWSKWWASQPPSDNYPDTLVIGNPPFSLAEEHVTCALSAMQGGDVLAFLLRIGFLFTRRRAGRLFGEWPSNLRYLIPLASRPSFVGGGTDSSEYAVFVWEKGWTGEVTILPHIFKPEKGSTVADAQRGDEP